MDTWSSVLLRAFLWSTAWAYDFKKPCVAYAVDSGHLSESNSRRVKIEASKTGLIIMRTQAAADRLRALGVSAPIEVTADTAFCYEPKSEDKNILWDIWPQSKENEVFGMALVDPYCWPVKMRLIGRQKDCYRWPYYFSRSSKRSRAADKLSGIFAVQADRLIEKYKKSVALICMESVDEAFAENTLKKIKNNEFVRIFSSSKYNASQMTTILRSLTFLISMRYHACVLSMINGIPMIGIAHDLRILDLFDDIGIKQDLCFEYDKLNLSLLSESVDQVLAHSSDYHRLLLECHKSHFNRAKRNKELLVGYLSKFGN
jgi:polysaccharide pyruvyl transferase WcaK-like protein